jgi:hypothetical protein
VQDPLGQHLGRSSLFHLYYNLLGEVLGCPMEIIRE